MKISIRHIIAVAVTGWVSLSNASAQELRTSYFMQTSNFRHQMNPALLDTPYATGLMGNINVGTTGNFGLSDFIYKLDNNPNYDYTTFMSPTVDANQFLNGLSDQVRGDVYVNFNIFSAAFRMCQGVSLLELNLRSNTNISLPKELFEFMKCTGSKEQYNLKDLGIRSQNYLELALGHSRNINDRLRVGAKLKFLVGAAYADFSANTLNLTMNGDYWRVQGDAQLRAAILKSELKHDLDKPLSADGRPRVDELDDIEFGLPGFGMALDLGATYRVLDNLTISAALTDLGFINWKETNQASVAGDYTFDGFENIHVKDEATRKNDLGDQFEDLGDDLEEMFAIYDDGKGKVKQGLAATLNVGAEYTLPVYRKLRFGFLYTSRIHGLYSWHQGMLSANIRPVKWLEASVNTAVSSTGVTFGGALNLHAPHFNFYIGADRFMGKVSKEFIPINSLNSNVNVGITFPL